MINITVEITRLSSAIAELRLSIDGPGELRGRLMGPRSPSGTTIEVAYPIKATRSDDGSCVATVMIPEPNFWEPENPLTYGGPVEVWRAGEKVHEQWIEVGLKQKS
jgi:hypothetical protein